jgi:hypothetical protein
VDLAEACQDSAKASIDENGAPVAGSEYEKYLKYCTQERPVAYGDQYEPYSSGSARDQAWYDGEECMHDSLMLRNFRSWTNYCLQGGTMDGDFDCHTHSLANTSAASNCGDGTNASIYTCALYYDPEGYGPYPHGQDTAKWSTDIHNNINPQTGAALKPGDLLADCSGLVTLAVWDAFHIDLQKDGGNIAPQSFESGHWTRVDDPKNNAQRGDVITFPDHVEIIDSVSPDKSKYITYGAHTTHPDSSLDISPSSYSIGGERGVFRFHK